MSRLVSTLLFALIASCIICTTIVDAFRIDVRNAVHLEKIKTLTLHKHAMTTASRSYSLPQLQCVGSYCPNSMLPNTVQCYNQGMDDQNNVQWKCDADMDNSISFDRVTVSCEGYDNRDDPYVLVGSCALSYSLKQRTTSSFAKTSHSEDTTNAVLIMFVILVLVVLVIIIVAAISSGDQGVTRVVHVTEPTPWYLGGWNWGSSHTTHHYHHNTGRSSSFWSNSAPATYSSSNSGSSGTSKSSGYGGTSNR